MQVRRLKITYLEFRRLNRNQVQGLLCRKRYRQID
jgi:hypothetical protein